MIKPCSNSNPYPSLACVYKGFTRRSNVIVPGISYNHKDLREKGGMPMVHLKWLASILALLMLVVAEVTAEELAPEGGGQAQDLAVQAADQGESSRPLLMINGFGNWDAGYTIKSDGNRLGKFASPGRGTYDNVNMALVVTAIPYEKLHIVSSIYLYTEDGEFAAQLDYAFAEWMFSDSFKLRVGQSKHPFGLYTEIYDVGTLRPFTMLPSCIYGPAGIVSEYYRGIGVSGNLIQETNWPMQYDFYFGSLPLPEEVPTEVLEAADPDYESGEGEESMSLQNVAGTKITFGTPVEGLSVGLSSYIGEIKAETEYGLRTTGGLHAKYQRGKFTAETEYVRFWEWYDESPDRQLDSVYADFSYMLTSEIQAALGYQFSHLELQDGATGKDSSLTKHQEASVGINYFFNPNFVLKLSYHYIYGNKFAYPELEDMETDVVAGTLELEKNTHVVLFGASFTF